MIEKPPRKPPQTLTAVATSLPSGSVATTLAAKSSLPASRFALGRVVRFGFNFLLVAVAGGCGWLFITNGQPRFENFLNIFLGLVLEVVPFLLLGAIMAALLATLGGSGVRANRLWQKLHRNRVGAA